MVIYGYQWLLMSFHGYLWLSWLLMSIHGHLWLSMVIDVFSWLFMVINGYQLMMLKAFVKKKKDDADE